MPKMPNSEGAERQHAIDALRGIVIILVLFNSYGATYEVAIGHARPLHLPSAGFLALQLFLSISAFRLLRETETMPNLRGYVAARLLHFLPALWVSVGVCVALSLATWQGSAAAWRGSNFVLPANLLMASDFFGLPTLDGAFWRLKLELLMSVGLATAWFAGRRRLSAGLLLAVLALAAVRLPFADPSHSHVFELAGALTCDGYIAPCAFGLAIYQLVRGERRLTWGAVAAVAFLQAGGINTPGHAAIVAGAFCLLALAAFGRLPTLSLCWPLVWLGDLSYPIYVAHQTPGFVLMRGLERAGVDAACAMAVAAALAVAIGFAIHHWVERPARRGVPAMAAQVVRRIREMRGRWAQRPGSGSQAGETSEGRETLESDAMLAGVGGLSTIPA